MQTSPLQRVSVEVGRGGVYGHSICERGRSTRTCSKEMRNQPRCRKGKEKTTKVLQRRERRKRKEGVED
ncbi:hypothetical protein CEXT_450341 [Caerostris extrusa]|uniref:Uncharacterized protein n=1 Tax=Caerostris extrusa TaxID=172846 RepID=A0AAV4XNM2_CAEEX|nr:hypothetical protein CEXT_450341 [Caerostris extrusa]